MVTPLPPCGPQLAWKNRRVLAERLRWPDGALEVCEAAELADPDFPLSWRNANTIKGFEMPAGFYAHYRGPDAFSFRYDDAEYVGDDIARLGAVFGLELTETTP